MFYGVREGVAEEAIGDRRRDPVARAPFLDPGMPVARWIAGRRAWSRGSSLEARDHFAAAAAARPASDLLLVDVATAWAATGRPATAAALWNRSRRPVDPRWALARAHANLDAGSTEQAVAIVGALPLEVREEAGVAELLVLASESLGEDAARLDALLFDWQRADEADPAPVRRRIALRVRQRRYAEALELTDELAQRGAGDEAGRKAVALLVALDRLDEAAARAEQTDPHLAARIRARAALSAGQMPDLEPSTAREHVEMGRIALAAGDRDAALAHAEAALARVPAFVDALALRADAGAQGPSTAPGSTGRGSQAQPSVP